MFFGSRLQSIDTNGKKVILVLGGSGVLGKAFAAAAPPDAVIINVSRGTHIETANAYNVPFNLNGNLSELFETLAGMVTRVDAMVAMAYTKKFSSIREFNRDSFIKEVLLDVVAPIEAGLLCGEYFWSTAKNPLDGRTVINVSSLAGYGKTARPELATYSGAKAALNIMTSYEHDFLQETYGASAHIVAPGSLQDTQVLTRVVEVLWGLCYNPLSTHVTEKID